MKIKIQLVLIAILLTLIYSCSSGGNPITPNSQSENQPIPPQVSSAGNPSILYPGVFGAWEVHIDTRKMTAEIIPARNAQAIGNIFDADLSQFLMVSPCSNCLMIAGVNIAADGYIHLDVRMKHPFSNLNSRPDLHGFDVRAIFISKYTSMPVSSMKITKPDGSQMDASNDPWFVMNADGFTSHYDELVNDPRYFISSQDCPATLNPYLRFFESYSSGVFDPLAPSGHNVMPTGSTAYSRTAVLWPYYEQLWFYIVADVAYGQSATLKNRQNPQYYLPSFNRTEPWRMEYWIENNNLALPELQRPKVWADSKIPRLLSSIYNNYPFGIFLIWTPKKDERIRCRAFAFDQNKQHNRKQIPSLYLVDGQQRLTAFYKALHNRGDVKVVFNIYTEDFELWNKKYSDKDGWYEVRHLLSFSDRERVDFALFFEQ